MLERYSLSIVPRENCTQILIENNINQLIIIENKNFIEITFTILKIIS